MESSRSTSPCSSRATMVSSSLSAASKLSAVTSEAAGFLSDEMTNAPENCPISRQPVPYGAAQPISPLGGSGGNDFPDLHPVFRDVFDAMRHKNLRQKPLLRK